MEAAFASYSSSLVKQKCRKRPIQALDACSRSDRRFSADRSPGKASCRPTYHPQFWRPALLHESPACISQKLSGHLSIDLHPFCSNWALLRGAALAVPAGPSLLRRLPGPTGSRTTGVCLTPLP